MTTCPFPSFPWSEKPYSRWYLQFWSMMIINVTRWSFYLVDRKSRKHTEVRPLVRWPWVDRCYLPQPPKEGWRERVLYTASDQFCQKSPAQAQSFLNEGIGRWRMERGFQNSRSERCMVVFVKYNVKNTCWAWALEDWTLECWEKNPAVGALYAQCMPGGQVSNVWFYARKCLKASSFLKPHLVPVTALHDYCCTQPNISHLGTYQ